MSFVDTSKFKGSVGIKFTSMCDLECLKIMNQIQRRIDVAFNPDWKIPELTRTRSEIRNNLIGQGMKFTDAEFDGFIAKISMPECDQIRAQHGNPEIVSLIEWRTTWGCLNLARPEIDADPVYQQFGSYSPEQRIKINNFIGRAKDVNEACKEKNVNP
jgi:hypothetical protein